MGMLSCVRSHLVRAVADLSRVDLYRFMKVVVNVESKSKSLSSSLSSPPYVRTIRGHTVRDLLHDFTMSILSALLSMLIDFGEGV